MVEGEGGREEEEEEKREREEGGGGGERRSREEEQGGGAGEGSCCTQRQSVGVQLPPRRPQMSHLTSSTAMGDPAPSMKAEPRGAEHWKPSGIGMS